MKKKKQRKQRKVNCMLMDLEDLQEKSMEMERAKLLMIQSEQDKKLREAEEQARRITVNTLEPKHFAVPAEPKASFEELRGILHQSFDYVRDHMCGFGDIDVALSARQSIEATIHILSVGVRLEKFKK